MSKSKPIMPPDEWIQSVRLRSGISTPQSKPQKIVCAASAEAPRCISCGELAQVQVNDYWFCGDVECQETLTQEQRWQIIEDILRRDYKDVDLEAIKASLAIVASHRITD